MFRTIIVSFGEIPDTIRRVFLLQNFVRKIVELIAADERSRSDYYLQSHRSSLQVIYESNILYLFNFQVVL